MEFSTPPVSPGLGPMAVPEDSPSSRVTFGGKESVAKTAEEAATALARFNSALSPPSTSKSPRSALKLSDGKGALVSGGKGTPLSSGGKHRKGALERSDEWATTQRVRERDAVRALEGEMEDLRRRNDELRRKEKNVTVLNAGLERRVKELEGELEKRSKYEDALNATLRRAEGEAEESRRQLMGGDSGKEVLDRVRMELAAALADRRAMNEAGRALAEEVAVLRSREARSHKAKQGQREGVGGWSTSTVKGKPPPPFSINNRAGTANAPPPSPLTPRAPPGGSGRGAGGGAASAMVEAIPFGRELAKLALPVAAAFLMLRWVLRSAGILWGARTYAS